MIQGQDVRPNILWIYLEDVSGWFSCYGDKVIKTPNIDNLADEGIRFNRFYTSAGVCSAMRSGTILGMMQTTVGAHHHRSCRADFRGKSMGEYDKNILPKGVRLVPKIFRDAGYYTFNEGSGKDDFNFEFDRDEIYDHHHGGWNFKGAKNGSDWNGCPDGKPFSDRFKSREVNRVSVRGKSFLVTGCLFHLTTQISPRLGRRLPIITIAFFLPMIKSVKLSLP